MMHLMKRCLFRILLAYMCHTALAAYGAEVPAAAPIPQGQFRLEVGKDLAAATNIAAVRMTVETAPAPSLE